MNSFSQQIQSLIQAIDENPTDRFRVSILADALEDEGSELSAGLRFMLLKGHWPSYWKLEKYEDWNMENGDPSDHNDFDVLTWFTKNKWRNASEDEISHEIWEQFDNSFWKNESWVDYKLLSDAIIAFARAYSKVEMKV